MLEVLDAESVRRWVVVTRAALAARRAEIDALNVFPVPDGDTGTNLLLTAQAALAALEREGARTTEPAWSVLSRGAVLGARGNSGTILAQLLRGLADQFAGQPDADGPALAAALERAMEGRPHSLVDVSHRQVGIEVSRRFVSEDDQRIVDDGAGDRDPLLLAARELDRVGGHPMLQSHPLEHLEGTALLL